MLAKSTGNEFRIGFAAINRFWCLLSRGLAVLFCSPKYDRYDSGTWLEPTFTPKRGDECFRGGRLDRMMW